MASTGQTSEQIVEQEIQEWKEFRRALKTDDHQALDQLLEKDGLNISAWDLHLKTMTV